MAILILSNPEDEHAQHVLAALRGRGQKVELFDTASVPATTRLSLGLDVVDTTLRLASGRAMAAQEITAIYWRNYRVPAVDALPNAGQRFIAENDARSLVESLLIRTPCRWVNGWDAFRLHQTKPVQLSLVAALGVPVPASLFTNDPVEVIRFATRYPRLIFKPVQGGAHARTLGRGQLDPDRLATLSCAPVTIQEEIPGTNVRVFVAGDRIAACEIKTTHLDYRDDARPVIVAMTLPEDIAAWCRRIAATLRLVWTGIDFRRTPEGRYVFLEANPSPMFLGFEQRCGLPLTDMLVDLLVNPGD